MKLSPEERDRQFRSCADMGLSQKQAAERTGYSHSTVSLWAKKNPDVKFSTAHRKEAAKHMNEMKDTGWKDGLSRAERDDVRTLMQKGEYTLKEAIEIVTTPPVKISMYRRAA